MPKTLDDIHGAQEKILAQLERQNDTSTRIASLLEEILAVSRTRRKLSDEQDLETQALVLLAQEDPLNINLSAIADRLGVNRRQLYRLPVFTKKLSELKQINMVAKRPTKGFRIARGGVEAVGVR